MTALDRARADLADGRPWLARDRLLGALRERPADQDILSLLGEVHVAMNDLPAAGAAWFLTDHADDVKARAATQALHDRYPRPASMGHVLPIHAQLSAYPPAVRARLVTLQRRYRDEGWTWSPPSRPQRTHVRSGPGAGPGGAGSTTGRWRGALEATIGIAVVGSFVLTWIVGLVTLARWIW